MRRWFIVLTVVLCAGIGVVAASGGGSSSARKAPHVRALTAQDITLAAAETTVFLQMDNVTGPASDTDHSQHGAVKSVAWGITAATSFASGGGASVGKANYDDLTLTRPVDKFSPVLAKNISTGLQVPGARIYLVATSKSPAITLVLDSVFVTHWGISGDSSNSTEQLTLTARTWHVIADGVDSGPLIRP